MLHSFFTSFASLPFADVAFFGLATFLLILAVLIGFVIQLNARLRLLTAPGYDRIVKDAEAKAEALIAEARAQSVALRAQAETAATAITVSRKEESERLQKAEEQRLETLTTQAAALLTKHSDAVAKLSESLEAAMQKQTDTASASVVSEAADITKALQGEAGALHKIIEDMRPQFEALYATLAKELQTSLAKELETDVRAAREAVAAYRMARMTALNAEIVSLVEETARLAFGQALSLETHRDIVLAALEQARREGVFTTRA